MTVPGFVALSFFLTCCSFLLFCHFLILENLLFVLLLLIYIIILIKIFSRSLSIIRFSYRFTSSGSKNTVNPCVHHGLTSFTVSQFLFNQLHSFCSASSNTFKHVDTNKKFYSSSWCFPSIAESDGERFICICIIKANMYVDIIYKIEIAQYK